jgi:hypothetical protein
LNWLFIGLFFGFLVGYVAVNLVRRRTVQQFLAVTEYWVYLPGEKMPLQDEVMKLVLQGAAIGPREGLVFSDIRLHISLVLRRKNPHIFRPDLFEEHIEPTPQILSDLSDAHALAKIRFLSEEPLGDDRHLQLLPYLAYAYAKLGNASVIYDVGAERLMSRDDLQAMLKADKNAARPDAHLRIVWVRNGANGRAETRGLVKKGLPELVTEEMEVDEQVLVTAVLDEAARTLWEKGVAGESLEVTSFDDVFKLLLSKPKDGRSNVKILRVRTA